MCTRNTILLAALLSMCLLAPLATARGGGEYRLLRPGKDGNLNWQEYHEVAGLAEQRPTPVMIYFFDSEKTVDNAQEMISAQLRLFPDEGVKSAAASLICTKVDWTDPDAVERAGTRRNRKAARKKDAETATAEEQPLILPVSKWPQEVCILFLDYRGREIERLSKISSNAGKFLTSIRRALAVNERNRKADEKAEEKAEQEAAKAAAKEAEEEAAKEAEEKSEDNGAEERAKEGKTDE